MKMNTYYLTFPYRLTEIRDGYYKVSAETYDQAREKVVERFGRTWAFLYEENRFQRKYFPQGCIGEIS